MKKILRENKLSLFLSSVIILLPQVVAALLGEHIYYLPLQCLVLHWICLLVTFYDWRKKPQEKKITQLMLWIMPVISMAGSAFILLVKSGQVSYTLAPYFMNVGFGLMFIVLGSSLPKIRRNRTMGIKVKWALENDDNWNATHRFGGKVWMGCGFVCLLCALFPFSGPGTGLFVAAVFAAAEYEGPVYLRFGRLGVPVLFDEQTYHFEWGRIVTLRDGSDVTIAATGLMVERALQAADVLAQQGISARVLDVHTLKPIDRDTILKAAAETRGIVTAEEHSVIGGLYSAVCETVCGEVPCRVKPVAVTDVFGSSGPALDLLELYGLNAETIVAKALELME